MLRTPVDSGYRYPRHRSPVSHSSIDVDQITCRYVDRILDLLLYSEKIKVTKEDKQILKSLEKLIKTVDVSLEKFRFADAADAIYHFMWHEVADKYIESVKQREDKDVALSVLTYVYVTCLKLLHPFMPFVTEAIYQQMPGHGESLMIEKWPIS